MKGGLKAMTMGNKPWSHREFWNPTNSYSGFYHSSGFAGKNIPIHHSFLYQNLGLGKKTPNFIKNQMFNLKEIKPRFINGVFYDSRQIHNAVHGVGKLKLSPLNKFIYGTPNWIYPFGFSTLGKGGNYFFNE